MQLSVHAGRTVVCQCGKPLVLPSAAAAHAYGLRKESYHQRKRRRLQVSAVSPDRPSDRSLVPTNQQSGAFGDVETRVASTFKQPGGRDDWQQVEGAWVLYPRHGQPKAVVHFVGGAFVGAAPQLTYRLLLELLATKQLLVVATPFPTGFNHLAISDEVQYIFDRCINKLGPGTKGLPMVGIGHSLGALVQVLISSRYPVERIGNVLLSYNNRPVTEALPFISPFLGPGAAVIAPILTRLAMSPLRVQMDGLSDLLRGMSPALVRQFMPLLDQLMPMYLDLANGRQEFIPGQQETRVLVRGCYGIARNLAIKFQDDPIDETNALATMLETDSAVASTLDLTVQTLPGDHMRPLMQEVPPEVSAGINQAAAQGQPLFNQLNQFMGSSGFQMDQLSRFADSFVNVLGSNARGDASALAAEIATWIEKRMQPLALPAGAPAGELKA